MTSRTVTGTQYEDSSSTAGRPTGVAIAAIGSRGPLLNARVVWGTLDDLNPTTRFNDPDAG
jgi:hypothetical protein